MSSRKLGKEILKFYLTIEGDLKVVKSICRCRYVDPLNGLDLKELKTRLRTTRRSAPTPSSAIREAESNPSPSLGLSRPTPMPETKGSSATRCPTTAPVTALASGIDRE